MTTVIYLPLGYRRGVALAAGVWCQSHPDIKPHWGDICNSPVSLTVRNNIIDAGIVTHMLTPLSVLRRQYRQTFGDDAAQHLQVSDLIAAIVAHQEALATPTDYKALPVAELRKLVGGAAVEGSGKNGAVTKRDLIAWLQAHD